MQLLIILRHGDYGDDDRLNDNGRSQMRRLVDLLNPHLKGRSVRVLTSTAPRAVDSTEVLVAGLGLDGFERHEVLWSDSVHHQNNAATLMLTREKFEDIDVLILVTHLEYVRDFPSVFGREVLDMSIDRRTLVKGKGYIIDCVDKTVTIIG